MKPAATSSPLRTPEANEKLVEALFLRFGAYYGHIWNNSFQNDAQLEFTKNEWAKALSAYQQKSIKEALIYCREKKAYPPTLPQFIECCRAEEKRWQQKFEPKEEQKLANPEVARRHLKQILNILHTRGV